MVRRKNGIADGGGISLENGSVRPGAWYADPYGADGERWWDGGRWTDRVRERLPSGGDCVAPSETRVSEVAAAFDLGWARSEPPVTEVGATFADGTVPSEPSADEPAAPTEAAETATATVNGTPPPLSSEQTDTAEVRSPQTNGYPSVPSVSEGPTRLCPHCAALAQTEGAFCPHCGTPFAAAHNSGGGASTRVKVIAGCILALLVLGAGGVAVAIKLHHDSQIAAQHRSAAAAVRARRHAAQQAQAVRAAERVQRQSLETQLQDAITTDATDKANQGLLFNGPTQSTTCTSVSGGSSQNLGASTGTYSCIAVYQSNGDGTQSGYNYTGTINFATGDTTWQLGGNGS